MLKRAMLAVGMLSVATSGISAQLGAPEGNMRDLLSARSLKCSFPWYAAADWNADEPKVKNAGQEFGFHIDSIDRANRSARIIGNAGAEDLGASYGADLVSFIEVVPVGSINLTTVYAWRDKAGRFKAVHSRHTAVGGPSPSQAYGYCQTW